MSKHAKFDPETTRHLARTGKWKGPGLVPQAPDDGPSGRVYVASYVPRAGLVESLGRRVKFWKR